MAVKSQRELNLKPKFEVWTCFSTFSDTLIKSLSIIDPKQIFVCSRAAERISLGGVREIYFHILQILDQDNFQFISGNPFQNSLDFIFWPKFQICEWPFLEHPAGISKYAHFFLRNFIAENWIFFGLLSDSQLESLKTKIFSRKFQSWGLNHFWPAFGLPARISKNEYFFLENFKAEDWIIFGLLSDSQLESPKTNIFFSDISKLRNEQFLGCFRTPSSNL